MANKTSPRSCPFCGEAPKLWTGKDWAAVSCANTDCPVQTVDTGNHVSPERATEPWNRRPLHDELVAMVERLAPYADFHENAQLAADARALLARAKEAA